MSVERSPKLIAPYLAVYLFVIGLTFYLTMNHWPQTNIGSMKKVRIDHGATLSNISDKLNKKGLVTNKWVFEFLTKIKGLEKSMQAGTFRVSNVHTNNEVINNIVFGSPDRKTVLLDYLGEIKQTEELGKEFLSNLAGPIIMKLSDQNNDGLDDIYVLNNGEIKKETSFLSPEREPLTKKQNFKNPIIDLMLLEKNPKKIFLLSTREVFLESWGKKIQLNEPVNKFIHLKDKTISMLDKKTGCFQSDHHY